MEDQQQNNTEIETNDSRVKSAASFAAAQLTIFYLFWIMFFGEVIRWNLADESLYRPLRDSFLIPFADFFYCRSPLGRKNNYRCSSSTALLCISTKDKALQEHE